MSVKEVQIGSVTFGGGQPFGLIAGPCAIESEEIALRTAETLKRLCEELRIPLVFKGSFDKANRTSIDSPRGVGLERGLAILEKVKAEFELPITTDVHEAWQCKPVGAVVDLIQIPAFLVRQTDLLVAAAQTGKPVNAKKAQFLAPEDMRNVTKKLQDSGCQDILLCERGTTFGYHSLVVDFAGLAEMRTFGFPVVFDATHSVQRPGGCGTSTGANRQAIPPLIAAAMAVGVDALFLETHPDPQNAISDRESQLPLDSLRPILEMAKRFNHE